MLPTPSVEWTVISEVLVPDEYVLDWLDAFPHHGEFVDGNITFTLPSGEVLECFRDGPHRANPWTVYEYALRVHALRP